MTSRNTLIDTPGNNLGMPWPVKSAHKTYHHTLCSHQLLCEFNFSDFLPWTFDTCLRSVLNMIFHLVIESLYITFDNCPLVSHSRTWLTGTQFFFHFVLPPFLPSFLFPLLPFLSFLPSPFLIFFLRHSLSLSPSFSSYFPSLSNNFSCT